MRAVPYRLRAEYAQGPHVFGNKRAGQHATSETDETLRPVLAWLGPSSWRQSPCWQIFSVWSTKPTRVGDNHEPHRRITCWSRCSRSSSSWRTWNHRLVQIVALVLMSYAGFIYYALNFIPEL